jgi:uncharacterized membrane protein
MGKSRGKKFSLCARCSGTSQHMLHVDLSAEVSFTMVFDMQALLYMAMVAVCIVLAWTSLPVNLY